MFVSLATTTREGERRRLDAVSGGTFECGRILAQGVLHIISRQPDLWKTGMGVGRVASGVQANVANFSEMTFCQIGMGSDGICVLNSVSAAVASSS